MSDLLELLAVIVALVAVLPIILAVFRYKHLLNRLAVLEHNNTDLLVRIRAVDKIIEAILALNSMKQSQWVMCEYYRRKGAWPEAKVSQRLDDGQKKLSRILNEALLFSVDERARRSAVQQLGMHVGDGGSLILMAELVDRLDGNDPDRQLVMECRDCLVTRLNNQ